MDLDNVNFISNDELRDGLARTDATSAQIDAAVEINTDARLDALHTGLLILAAVSALALLPARRLPNYRRGELPGPGTTS